MAPWLYLLLAFALGWLIGFLIDWWYWRRQGAQMQASLEACRADGAKVRADLDSARKQLTTITTDLQAARADNDNLRLQLTKGMQGLAAPGLAAAGGAALGAAAAAGGEDVEAYKQQIADLEAKLDVLQKDLDATRDDRWRIRGEAAEGESDEAALREDNARLQAEVVALKKQMEESDTGAKGLVGPGLAAGMGAALGAAAAADKDAAEEAQPEEEPGVSPAAATATGVVLGAEAAADKGEVEEAQPEEEPGMSPAAAVVGAGAVAGAMYTADDVEAYQRQITDLEAQVEGLQKELEASAGRETVAPAVAAGAAVGAEAGKTEDVEPYKKQIADLEAEVADLQKQLASATESSSRVDKPGLMGATVGAVAGMMHKSEDAEAYEKQIADLQAQVEGLQKELEASSAKGMVSPAVAAGAGAVVGAAVSQPEDVEPYKERIADLEAQVEGLQKELEASAGRETVAPAVAAGAAVGAEVGKAEDVEPYKKQIAGLEAEVADLQKQLASATESSSRVDKPGLMGATVGAVAGMMHKSEDAEAYEKQIADLQAQVEGLQKELEASSAKGMVSPAVAAGAGAVVGAAVSQPEDVEPYKKQIADLQVQVEGLQKELEASSAKGMVSPAVAAGAGAVVGVVASKTEDVEPYKERIADLEAQLNGCHSDVQASRLEVAHLQSEVKKLAVGAAAAISKEGTAEVKAEEKPGVSPTAAVAATGMAAAGAAQTLSSDEPKGDDLEMIEGIGPRIAELLRADGITTFAQLAAAKPADLKVILDKGGPAFNRADPETWPEQAALAARGDWDDLKKLQAQLIGGRRIKGDDLEMIEGIGPRIAELLAAGGITTFARLAATPQSELEAILDKGGPAFNRADPETWPEQAALAARGDTEGLAKLQAQLIGGRRLKADDLALIEGIGPKTAELLRANGITSFRQLAATDPAQLKAILAKGGPAFNYADPGTWPEQADLLARGDTARFNALTAELVAGRRRADDLAALQGVSPAVAAALGAHGIKSYKQLADTDRASLESLLAETGATSGGLNYDALSEQATLAAGGDWDELKDYQDRLKADASAAPDDLTVIEGIGPKIAEVLSRGGIRTYWRLWHTTPPTVRQLLDAAGPQYRIADPTSWPEQAALLAKGDKAAFEALTARLVGGREPGPAAPAGAAAAAPTSAARTADDLTQIRGIGPSIAKALTGAGITTFDELAAQTPERLREIVIPIAGPNVEVQVWIIRARELASDPSRRQS